MSRTKRAFKNGFRRLTLVVLSGFTAISGKAQAPEFVYPAQSTGPKLRLVSVYCNPQAGSLMQSGENCGDELTRPTRLARSEDELYVLDARKGKVYRSRYQHNTLVSADILPRGERVFHSATGVTLDGAGRMWLVDSRLKTVFVIDSAGRLLDSVAAEFHRPVGVVYHAGLNRTLVTDLGKNSIYIVNAQSGYEVERIHTDAAHMQGPASLAVGPQGRIYVCNALGGNVSVYDSTFTFVRTIGEFGDGPGAFARPKGVAVDKDGLVYVSDALFDNVQIFNADGELLLTLGQTGTGPGEFSQPQGVLIDSDGLLYVADSFNKRVQMFRWER